MPPQTEKWRPFRAENEARKNLVTESKLVELPRALTVKELGDLLRVSAVEIIKELMKNGLMASINQVIDYDTAAIIATDFGFDPKEIGEVAVAEVIVERAPARQEQEKEEEEAG